MAHSEHAIVNFAAEPGTHAAVAPAAPAGMPLTLKGTNFASGGSGAGGPGESHASFGQDRLHPHQKIRASARHCFISHHPIADCRKHVFFPHLRSLKS